ncbi:MAG: lipid-A-disaccharide synthase [Epsilonproteobacteria bacterium]|nr:lipid-A-disaccharide synthase [Campylobacterota bacterium]
MKLLVSAIESSANLHLKSLLSYLPSYKLLGIFDSNLDSGGIDLQREAIMGFKDAIKKLPFFYKLANLMVDYSFEADKVLLIDSSGFNLPLAKKIKRANPKVEINYYILPQAWAWRRGRVYSLSKYCDNLLSILPFEKEIYPKEANIKYVGHPLLDQIKEYKDSTAKEPNTILFMPGSRKSEIRYLMPIFKEVAKKIGKRALLAIPPHLKNSLSLYGDISGFEIFYNSQEALKEADFAFICSGTATLEAAIMGTPFILAYKAKPIDYFIGKHLIKLNYIGLANIFFEKMQREPMHPELIQEEVTASNLLEEFKRFNFDNFVANSKILREYLKEGSAKNVASILLS